MPLKPINPKDVNLSFRTDKKTRDYYQRLYPSTMSRFLNNCLKCANKDSEFFTSVFFINFDDSEVK